MYFTKYPILLLFLFFPLCPTWAQSVVRWEPEFSFTWKPEGRWSYNATIGGRNVWLEGTDQLNTNYRWAHLEGRLFATYSLFSGNKIGGGYQYRRANLFDDEPGYEHRLMQQFAFITFVEDRRFGHRIRSEQRIREQGTIQRLRYRLSYDFPLLGRQLDTGEPYIILSNEVLWSLARSLSEVDNRIFVGIGWALSRQRKIETGLQYRVEAYNTDEMESIFQLVTSYFINR